MKKVIEVEFPEGFVPPEEYDTPREETDYRSACDFCPFFMWDDHRGCGWCVLLTPEPATDVCPIKKYFSTDAEPKQGVNYTELIVKNGTVRIPSIFMFEDWIDVEPFLTHARKMNCTVIFENENITVEPDDYESVRRKIALFVTIISYREIGNAYVRYLGSPDKMRWDNVGKQG